MQKTRLCRPPPHIDRYVRRQYRERRAASCLANRDGMRVRPCRRNRYRVSVRPGRRDAEPVRVLTSPRGAEAVRMIALS